MLDIPDEAIRPIATKVGATAVSRVDGESSHRVYRLQTPDGPVACKAFTRRHGDEPEREWDTLVALERAGFAEAPRPIVRDGDVVAMSWVGGVPSADVDPQRLADLFRRLHAVPAGCLRVARAHPSPRLLDRMLSWRVDWARYPQAAAHLQSSEVGKLVDHEPTVLVRDDGNSKNFLWDGTRLAMVDFEDAGLGDRAIELGEVIEHVQSRDRDDAYWDAFLDASDLSVDERVCVAASRRLFAVWWLAVLASRPGRETDAAAQWDRVQALLA